MNLYIPKKSRVFTAAAICAGFNLFVGIAVEAVNLLARYRTSLEVEHTSVFSDNWFWNRGVYLLIDVLFFIFILYFAKRDVKWVLIPPVLLIAVRIIPVTYRMITSSAQIDFADFMGVAEVYLRMGCLASTVILFYYTLVKSHNYKQLRTICIILGVVAWFLPIIWDFLALFTNPFYSEIVEEFFWQSLLGSILTWFSQIFYYAAIILIAFALKEKED